jgi:hypothetical protein
MEVLKTLVMTDAVCILGESATLLFTKVIEKNLQTVASYLLKD